MLFFDILIVFIISLPNIIINRSKNFGKMKKFISAFRKTRKISLLQILCITVILLSSAACDKFCGMKPPKDVKPIDWDNYNDVHTVFWNYYTLCSETKEKDRGKEIMVSGWISQGAYKSALFFVEDVSKTNDNNNTPLAMGNIPIVSIDLELQNKLDTSDITKKCYVKGTLDFDCLYVMSRVCESKSRPKINVLNADDIYFK